MYFGIEMICDDLRIVSGTAVTITRFTASDSVCDGRLEYLPIMKMTLTENLGWCRGRCCNGLRLSKRNPSQHALEDSEVRRTQRLKDGYCGLAKPFIEFVLATWLFDARGSPPGTDVVRIVHGKTEGVQRIRVYSNTLWNGLHVSEREGRCGSAKKDTLGRMQTRVLSAAACTLAPARLCATLDNTS